MPPPAGGADRAALEEQARVLKAEAVRVKTELIRIQYMLDETMAALMRPAAEPAPGETNAPKAPEPPK